MVEKTTQDNSLRKIVRWALIAFVIAAISYVPLSVIPRLIASHGQPDPAPKPWPMGP
jgi:uncharacterized membrane protein YjfL (UPF0719 family)